MSATPLQWEQRNDGRVFRFSHPNIYSIWTDGTLWYAARRDAYAIDAQEVCIYRGDSWAEAEATVKAYCATESRAAAWERYMAENDPPSNGEAL